MRADSGALSQKTSSMRFEAGDTEPAARLRAGAIHPFVRAGPYGLRLPLMNMLVAIAVRTLEVLFFAGWIGSALVIFLSGIEDAHSVFAGEETGEAS